MSVESLRLTVKAHSTFTDKIKTQLVPRYKIPGDISLPSLLGDVESVVSPS